MEIIGKAVFKNLDAFWSWYASAGLEWAKEAWPNHFHNLQSSEKNSALCGAFQSLFGFGNGFPDRARHPERVRQLSESQFVRLEKTDRYLRQRGHQWDVRYLSRDPAYILISYGANPKNRFIIPDPEQWFNYTPFRDYSGLNVSGLRQLAVGRGEASISAASLVPASLPGETSVSLLQDDLTSQQEKLARAEQEIEDVKNAKTGELAELQRRIDEQMAILNARKEALLAELNVKVAEINAQKLKMEQQLFVLESEIYSIRCFLGETVDFQRLRTGASAPIDTPVVLYQKLRFLDEDLGKFAIQHPDEPITDCLEDALAESDLLRDMFLPAEKCIVILQLSKDGKTFLPHTNAKYCNMLQEYDILHGFQLAILIRNGENLYIAWTDEDRLSLSADNFFLTPKSTVVEPLPEKDRYESDEAFAKRLDAAQQRSLLDSLTRHFLFSILNGVSAAENSFLPLPKFQDQAERERHIVFSWADNTLEDKRFGSFEDIIKRCNSRISKGDYILMFQSLRAESNPDTHWGNRSWYNDRGIGEANRTHDVHAWDGTVYPINLILQDPPREMIHYTSSDGVDHGWHIEADRESSLNKGCKVIERYTRIDKHYYISLEKTWSPAGARANFEIYPDEFINLTFLSSTHINYLLSTKRVAGWRVGGKEVNYAYALKYFGEALKHIKGREEMEQSRIEAAGGMAIISNPDWPALLSDWKMEHGVRQITDYQARRFVRDMENRKN